jgi:hypothetical protein
VGVNAHVAVIFAAHLNRTHGAIPAGVFTRGDATRVFANPTETFVRVHMSGLELKTFLESAMCSSDPEGAPFPFASGVRWDYDNVTTPAASNFAVLAPGSDRVWVPLDDADAFVVVMPYSVAVDTSNTWSGVGVSSFASGFPRYSVGDGDFKTVFAEHAEALGVLTQTSPGTRSMRTFTGASGVHAHAFDKGNEMHVKLNVTEGQIPVLIQFVSYDACVADAVEGVAVATGVFVAAKLPIVRKPRFGDEFVYGDCAIAVALAVAVDGRNGLLRSFDRHYANRWLHVPRDVREMRVLQLAKYRR